MAGQKLVDKLKNLIESVNRISLEEAAKLLKSTIEEVETASKDLSDDFLMVKEGDDTYLEYDKKPVNKEKKEQARPRPKEPEIKEKLKPKEEPKHKIEIKPKEELKPKAQILHKEEPKTRVEIKSKEVPKKTEIKPKEEPKPKIEIKPKEELKPKAEIRPKEDKREEHIKPKIEIKPKEIKKEKPLKDRIVEFFFKKTPEQEKKANINSQVQSILGLISENYDIEHVTELESEKELMSSFLEDIKNTKSIVASSGEKFLTALQEIEAHFKAIKDMQDKLKKLDSKMDELSNDIEARSRKVSGDISKLKNSASLFKDLESKLESEKRSVFEKLRSIKGEVSKEQHKEHVQPFIVSTIIPKLKAEKAVLSQEEIKKMSEDVVEEALEDTKVEVKPVVVEEKKKLSTGIDKVLDLVKKKGKVSFTKLTALLEEKSATIEEWCEALEEQGLVEIVYPLLGSPYIKYREQKLEEKDEGNNS